MRDPIGYLKRLPWIPLVQIASLAIVILTIVEIIVIWSARNLPLVEQALGILLSPPLNTLMFLAIAAGLGAIAVLCLERLRRDVPIGLGVLWTLILCLNLVLGLKAVSNFPMILPSGQATLMGTILGVFWKGKAYWR